MYVNIYIYIYIYLYIYIYMYVYIYKYKNSIYRETFIRYYLLHITDILYYCLILHLITSIHIHKCLVKIEVRNF